jgi:hypothetical protein
MPAHLHVTVGASGSDQTTRGELPVRLHLAGAASHGSDQATTESTEGYPSYPAISDPPPYTTSLPCTLCCDLSQNGYTGDHPDGRSLRKLSVTQVSRSAQQGCRGCQILSEGIHLLEPELAQLLPMSRKEADTYDIIQRLGYTVFFDDGVPKRDKVINIT